MTFIKVCQKGQEFLLNTNYIVKVYKGEAKYEFLLLLENESSFFTYEIFGSGGIRCEKLAAVKKILLLDKKET